MGGGLFLFFLVSLGVLFVFFAFFCCLVLFCVCV